MINHFGRQFGNIQRCVQMLRPIKQQQDVSKRMFRERKRKEKELLEIKMAEIRNSVEELETREALPENKARGQKDFKKGDERKEIEGLV